ncbi:MAG: 4'-phosphopantetheinyl transferase superfamily protein, partial [Chloroflexi bacterium]|nr:4'-phosphopantetheinyl transferase superfamily protein [Chloroflexota bacterium]
ILYRPTPPPGQRFAQQLRLRDVQERTLRADHDIVASDGALWMRVIGWEDWRFYWEPSFYDFWRHPDRHIIGHAIELPGQIGHQDATCFRMQPFGEIESNIWENLYAHLILSRSELSEYHSMPRSERRTQWLFGRSAAKDAVRSWIARTGGPKLYPADVVIGTDDHGRPVAGGAWAARVAEVPRISISHKGLIAVAAASRRQIGIDLERVEPREASFEGAAFDPGEQQILRGYAGADRDEWVTRLWCAKEAAAKAIGVGLRYGPGTVVARRVDPESGTVIVVYGASPAERIEIPVHCRRTGEFVMALAALEGNGHGSH